MIPFFYLVIKQLNTYTAGIRKQKNKTGHDFSKQKTQL